QNHLRAIRNIFPGLTKIIGLPKTSAGGAHVKNIGLSDYAGYSGRSSTAGGTNISKFKVLI
ncbi:MAG: hypothetical protein AAF489_13285, partial [Bacteroidota bacterium]